MTGLGPEPNLSTLHTSILLSSIALHRIKSTILYSVHDVRHSRPRPGPYTSSQAPQTYLSGLLPLPLSESGRNLGSPTTVTSAWSFPLLHIHPQPHRALVVAAAYT